MFFLVILNKFNFGRHFYKGILIIFSARTPSQDLQYVYLDFNLNVPIPWRCITCLVVLTGNSFSIYVHAGRGWRNLSNNYFCENRTAGSIVALLVEWKVNERACKRLIEAVIRITLFQLFH